MKLPIRLSILAGSALALLLIGLPQAQAGVWPSLSWSPSTGPGTFAYAPIPAGTTSSQTFTLRNSGVLLGTGALRVTLTGSSAYTIAGNTCSGTRLGPKKTCTVTVRYAPTTPGQTDTATLTATSNIPSARASQTLTGSALKGPILATTYSQCNANFSSCRLTIVGYGLMPGATVNYCFANGDCNPSFVRAVASDGTVNQTGGAFCAKGTRFRTLTASGETIYSASAVCTFP